MSVTVAPPSPRLVELARHDAYEQPVDVWRSLSLHRGRCFVAAAAGAATTWGARLLLPGHVCLGTATDRAVLEAQLERLVTDRPAGPSPLRA